MLHECDSWKILEIFFKQPTKDFHLRELSRILKWGPGRVKRNIKNHLKQNIISEERTKLTKKYRANINSENYKSLKIIYNLSVLLESANYIEKDLEYPETIILFGSASKGEDIEKSDVDICIIGKEKEINLKDLEKKLNRKIRILFFSNEKIKEAKLKSPELLNETINGIVLKGYFKVF